MLSLRNKEDIIKYRDGLQELANLANELLILEDKEETEEVEKEYECLLGRFTIAFLKLQELSK